MSSSLFIESSFPRSKATPDSGFHWLRRTRFRPSRKRKLVSRSSGRRCRIAIMATTFACFIRNLPSTGEDPGRFLRPEKLVPLNETFKTLAEQATAGKKDDVDRAKVLYDHVLGRMSYDKSGTGWGRGDAIYACDAKTGNCSDFHAYFIALSRSVGIPARFAIG